MPNKTRPSHFSTTSKRIASGLPTTRKFARSLNTSAFSGTNPADEPITSGLPVTREELRIPSRESLQRKADFSIKRCIGCRPLEMTTITLRFELQLFRIQLRVDTELSHSIEKRSSVDTQAGRSFVSTTDAAFASGKRVYDLLALLPFILVGGSGDFRSRTVCFCEPFASFPLRPRRWSSPCSANEEDELLAALSKPPADVVPIARNKSARKSA